MSDANTSTGDAGSGHERYYLGLAAAFVRGRLGDTLSSEERLDDAIALERGRAAGLPMHRFKRVDGGRLPRVRRVLGILAGLAPVSLIDLGSGRGAFLWPLLDAFPELPVTAVEADRRRAEDLAAVAAGGLDRLDVVVADAAAVDLGDASFDGVTLLEVLEHVRAPDRLVSEAMRLGRRFVIASVPSKADDNPEHLRVFDPEALSASFRRAGAARTTLFGVRGHIIVLAMR